MIVTIDIPAETKAKIQRDCAAAGRFAAELASSLGTGVAAGAEAVRRQLVMGSLGLEMRHPGQGGLAGAVEGWIDDPAAPAGAIGVRAGQPAARYARMLELGGTITPKTAKALAVPVSEAARQFTSPRDQAGLTLIPRKGKPGLLVEQLAGGGGGRGGRWIVHWVLVSSVTIRRRLWLALGVRRARGEITDATQDRMREYVRQWR